MKVRNLSPTELHHLVKLAAGLLSKTDGDVRRAMSLAMQRHFSLLAAVRNEGIAADLGPGEVVLHVPEDGGIALRMRRHPRPDAEEQTPTEEVDYAEMDLLGFEVYEGASGTHSSTPRLDAGTLDVDGDWHD